MSADDNVTLVQRIMEEFTRTGNSEVLIGASTEDIVVKAAIAEGTPLSGAFRGREGFARYLEAWNEALEIIDFRDLDYAGSADKVVLLGTEKVRVKRTGKVFETEAATVFTLREGKIAKFVALADMSAIVDAYGGMGTAP